MQTGLKVFQDPLNNLPSLIKKRNLNRASQRIWNHFKYRKLLKIQKPEAFLQRNWLFEY